VDAPSENPPPPPYKVLHQAQIPVRITDLNYGSHVGNATLVEYLHEARVQFLRANGLSELHVGDGSGLILKELSVSFHAQIFYPSHLHIRISGEIVSRTSFHLIYEITTESHSTPLATARTLMVCYDYSTQKIRRIPESLQSLLS